MRHYATTASAAYLKRLKVLHASMRRHCQPFRLHVLAEGDEVAEWARAQPNVMAMTLPTFLAFHEDLHPTRLPGPPRSPSELAWCWRWRFTAEIAARVPVLAIDADIMFWSSPEPVFDEIGGAPVALLPHAFAPASRGLPGVTYETHRRYGLYNGGFVYFNAPGPAERLAEMTRQFSRAAEHEVPGGRRIWGEQGWLEILAEETRAHAIAHPGAAPGPWNIHTRPLEVLEGTVVFGWKPLVSFHYHSYGAAQLADPNYQVSPAQAAILYAPYERALAAAT